MNMRRTHTAVSTACALLDDERTRSISLRAHRTQRLRLLHCCLLLAAYVVQGCGGGGGGGGGTPSGGNTSNGANTSNGGGTSNGGALPPIQGFYASPEQVDTTLQFTDIAAGYHHTCALATSGDTYCWGYNEFDQLGSSEPMETCNGGMFACSGVPILVDGGHAFTDLALGIRHSCGLDAAGDTYCWGFGLGGQLGDGTRTNSRTPVAVAGGLKFTALAASAASGATCGLTATREAWCWGINSFGSLGNGTESDGAYVPAPVATSLKLTSISTTDNDACAVSAAGDALCWGNNWYGVLGVGSAGGDGGVSSSFVPVAVLGGYKFDQIAVDAYHACALQTGGTVYCWGLSDTLGAVGPDAYVSLPQELVHSGSPWTSLGIGYGQTCALTVDGALDCWGQVLSQEPFTTTLSPLRISSNQAFIAFAVGGTHQCAIGADGFAYCWGGNDWGQVGQPPSDP